MLNTQIKSVCCVIGAPFHETFSSHEKNNTEYQYPVILMENVKKIPILKKMIPRQYGVKGPYIRSHPYEIQIKQ